MGQSSSRNEANSQDERPRHTRTSLWRSSSLFGPPPDQGPPSRARRYSSNIVDALLQRSNTDAPVTATATATEARPTTVLRRRSRFSRAASSLSMTARSVVRDPFATSNAEALPQSFSSETAPAAVSRPLTPMPPQPAQHLDASSDTTIPQRPQSPRSDSSRPQSPRPHRLPGLPTPTGAYPTSRFSSNRSRRMSMTDSISSPLPHRDFRQSLHFPSFRRRRSPALPTSGSDTDSNAVLSRLLSIAAAATAATSIGVSPDAAINDLRNAGGEIDGEDGTFSGFLQALSSGRLTGFGHGQGHRSQDNLAASADTAPQALEFFRMFRFGSINNTRQRPPERATSPNISSGTGVDQPTTASEVNQDQGAEQRMVPVLIVGIRALIGETDALHDNGEAIPSFLNAMTGVPREFGTEIAEAIDRLRRARRRATLGGMNLSNTQDTMRSMHSYRRPRSIDGLPEYSSSTSNTPAGETLNPASTRERLRMRRSLRPRSMNGLPEHSSTASLSPPADTPPTYHGTSDSDFAEPASSRARTRRIPHRSRSLLRRLINESFPEHSSDEDDMDLNPRPTRRRRLSDSDTPRHGSGSPRRNGVLVEPAEEPTEGSTGETRSWIIYILGGSYPEGHPILSTPSLFSDSPTYEDMLRLSSMLGPVKPPVADASDVDAAGGVLKVKIVDGVIQAFGAEGEWQITILDERCLVCLCEYEDKEEVRQLHKCSHVFHRECIDQWLTTGRNSCPLCRGQGVVERPIPAPETAESAEAGPSTSV